MLTTTPTATQTQQLSQRERDWFIALFPFIRAVTLRGVERHRLVNPIRRLQELCLLGTDFRDSEAGKAFIIKLKSIGCTMELALDGCLQVDYRRWCYFRDNVVGDACSADAEASETLVGSDNHTNEERELLQHLCYLASQEDALQAQRRALTAQIASLDAEMGAVQELRSETDVALQDLRQSRERVSRLHARLTQSAAPELRQVG